MSVLIITYANKNIIHATCILYWLDLTVARHFHDCKHSASRFANFGTGFILSLFWNKFILQRMITCWRHVMWCERSNQLTSVVWRHFGWIQRWLHSELKFWSVKFTGRIVLCQVFRICKLKSIYTVDKLYRRTVRSAWSQHHNWLCVSANCDR